MSFKTYCSRREQQQIWREEGEMVASKRRERQYDFSEKAN